MECSICGASQPDNMLLDVISSKEIIKVCESCSIKEKLPILRRPTAFQLKEAEKIVPYYKRVGDSRDRKLVSEKVEITTLKQIVDRNYEKNIAVEKKPRPDLVDNFHWIIMRGRRNKKITQEQLAKEISESEAAIKMAESGILPDEGYNLVRKLESFLGITLVKSEVKQPISEKSPARILKFDPSTVQNLTISDLKRLKEEKNKVFSAIDEEKEMNSEPEFEDADLEEPGYSKDFDKKYIDEDEM